MALTECEEAPAVIPPLMPHILLTAADIPSASRLRLPYAIRPSQLFLLPVCSDCLCMHLSILSLASPHSIRLACASLYNEVPLLNWIQLASYKRPYLSLVLS